MVKKGEGLRNYYKFRLGIPLIKTFLLKKVYGIMITHGCIGNQI